MAEIEQIKPQEGFQIRFLSSSADIIIAGGAAGGGKSYSLLMDASRHVDNSKYRATIFRRTMPQIKNAGGLWDDSVNIYGKTGRAKPSFGIAQWDWESGARIKFTHLQHEKDIYTHQGAQYAFIGFDEITHFTKKQFLYLLTRNRSTCGIRPVVRATCNPDPDSFVFDLISWWIDEDGWVIPERIGKMRYFTVYKEAFIFGNTPEEVIEKCPELFSDPLIFNNVKVEDMVKSLEFVPGRITDNKELLRTNPSYLANLNAQSDEVRNQLLYGNWKAVQDTLALCKFNKINDVFSNILDNETAEKYITCDVARTGRDLAIVLTWKGWEIVEIDVYTVIENLKELNGVIEERRGQYRIGASNVIYDADGLGVGVGDYSVGYQEFHALQSPVNPIYDFLKTEVHYLLAEKVNTNKIRINVTKENCRVDGKPSISVAIGGTEYDIQKLIKKQLKSIKRKKETDLHEKKRLQSKEEQKAMLDGMSPDFTDAMSLRGVPDLKNYGLYYENINAAVHFQNVEYRSDLALHLAFASNQLHFANLVLFQIFRTSTGKYQINAIKNFALRTPRSTVDSLCDEFMSWILERGIYNEVLNKQLVYYLRPLGSGGKYEDIYLKDASLIRNKLNQVFKTQSKTLLDFKQDFEYRNFAKSLLSDETFLVRINPSECLNLVHDITTCTINKEGNKNQNDKNASGPTNAFFNNALSVLFKKHYYNLRK